MEFEEFWNAYPRKEGKKRALSAYKGLSKTNRQAALADIQAGRFNGKEKQFIPHAATYLNGERWRDQVDAGKAGERKPLSAIEIMRLEQQAAMQNRRTD